MPSCNKYSSQDSHSTVFPHSWLSRELLRFWVLCKTLLFHNRSNFPKVTKAIHFSWQRCRAGSYKLHLIQHHLPERPALLCSANLCSPPALLVSLKARHQSICHPESLPDDRDSQHIMEDLSGLVVQLAAFSQT